MPRSKLDQGTYDRLWGKTSGQNYQSRCSSFANLACDYWIDDYRSFCKRRVPKIYEIDLGFYYLFDTSAGARGEQEERVVVVYGFSKIQKQKRDSSYMRGFPSPNSKADFALDKGHFAAHGQGGDEQGINLFPQERRTNRGWEGGGKNFRAMERELAANMGTFFWSRPIYSDGSYFPQFLEYGLVRMQTEELLVEQFQNS